MVHGAKFVPINQPPGYKIGDGKWGLNGPNGPVASEPNKLYRVEEVDFDLIHVDNQEIANHLTKFYPELPSVSNLGGSNIEDIKEKYQSILA